MNVFRRMWDAFDGWRYRRWLKSPEGQRYVAAIAWLAENQETATLHEISPAVALTWARQD